MKEAPKRHTSVRKMFKPDSEVVLQHIWGYTAYLFRHIQYEFEVDVEEIQWMEKNLEMIIDKEFGDIYAYRFDFSDKLEEIMEYDGSWEFTEQGKELMEKDQLRLKLLCRDRAWN